MILSDLGQKAAQNYLNNTVNRIVDDIPTPVFGP